MTDVYREKRSSYYDRDDSVSDDERYKSVRRYKVNTGGGGHFLEVEEDRKSRVSGYASERPRSSFEPARDRSRSFFYERDVDREPDRTRTVVYESRDNDRGWDRRPRRGGNDDEIKVEKHFDERFDDHGYDIERYRKETEYYTQADPSPAPIIIRHRAPDPQKIIVQEAPPPAPIVLPRQEPNIVVLREKESKRQVAPRESSEDYYYRREVREVGPYRGDDRDWAVVERRRRGPRHRDGDYHSDDEDFYMRRSDVRRERSQSPLHPLRLAEGALAGAGITALLQSRRNDYGEVPQHRGRKVLAGAALGALGAEAVTRARSAYDDLHGDDDRSPDRHSNLKKALGITAVALAAAGAAKFYETSKVDREEARRGRSRHKYYSSDEGDSGPKARKASGRRSLSTAAKAALGTAVAAGVAEHFQEKSKSRHGSRSRSKSKWRKGAEIVGAAAVGGLAAKAWKSHQEKEKGEHERSLSRDGHDRDRSFSRSRSRARSFYSDDGADPELGLVEYGDGDPPSGEPYSAYESEAEERRRRHQRRRRSASMSGSDTDKKRSRSRFKDMAAGAAAAGAAALGLKEYEKHKNREERERRLRERGSRTRDSPHSRDPSEDGYRKDSRDQPDSPPMASGGAYYPPYPSPPPAEGGAPPAVGQHFDNGEAHHYQQYAPQDYTGYPPPEPSGPPPVEDGGGYPPPPPAGPPPANGHPPPDHVSETSHRQSDDMGGSDEAAVRGKLRHSRNRAESAPAPSKSVSFIPLSPKSSMTMEQHRRGHGPGDDSDSTRQLGDSDEDGGLSDEDGSGTDRRHPHSVGLRPSADRPMRLSRRDAEDNDVEDLPRRFDSHGQPLEGASYPRRGPATRRGEFQYRPQRQGDWDVRGAWQVSGTDGEEVERIVRNVTGVLEGKGTWMGLLGQVLGNHLLGPGRDGGRDGDGADDDDEQGQRRACRRRT